MDDLRYSLGLDGSKFDGVVTRSLSGVQGLGGALAALGGAGAFAALIKRGFEFNKTMGDSEAAIAQVLAQFKNLDAQASKREAAAAMQQLIDLEPKAAGSLRDLTGGFLATLAASSSAGLSVKQNIDLVGRFANAMANAAIPTDQLAQEMRSIITANIGADSSLARILGITNEMVNQAREAGTLYEFLTTRIGKLGEAGDTAAVAFSSLESAIDKASGALAKGLFVQALDGSKSLTESINENEAAFEALGTALATVTSLAVDVFSGVNEAMRGVGATAAVVSDMLRNGSSWSDAWANAQAAFNAELDATAAKAAAAKEAAAPSTTTGMPEAVGSSRSGRGGSASDGKAMAEARNQLLLEVAIADAIAAGQDKKAAALQRELDLRRETLRIIRETGASEAQAAALAERLLQRKNATEGEGEARKRGKIFHTGNHIKMGSEGGGGLDRFHQNQVKREVSTEEMAANRAARGGGRGLPIGQSSGFVPAFPAFSGPGGRTPIPGLTNNPNAVPVGTRARAALSPPSPSTGSRSGNGDPSLAELKNISTELRRLRTA